MGCSSNEVLETKNKNIQSKKQIEEIINQTNKNSKIDSKETKNNKEEENSKRLNDKKKEEKLSDNLKIKEKEIKEMSTQLNKNHQKGPTKREGEDKKQIEEKIYSGKSEEIKVKIEDIKEQVNEEIFSDDRNNKKNSNGLLSGVKSEYILKIIIGYISQKKKLYLISYSKFFQKLLNISLKDYKERNLETNIYLNDIHQYLCWNYNSYFYDNNKIERKEFFQKFLSEYNYDKNILEEYIIKKFDKTYKISQGDFYGFHADINNPFFNSISKSNLMKGFIITINDDIFKNNNYFSDLRNFIEKLEVYPKIELVLTFNYLDRIKSLNIDFKKVKRLLLNHPIMNPLFGQVYDENEYLKRLNSFICDMKRLEDLYLIIPNHIKAESVEIINDFINLKSLTIACTNLDGVLSIKLTNLNKLTISGTKNIAFEENKIYKVETLNIYRSKIIKPKSLLNFPEIKSINTDSPEVYKLFNLNIAKQLKYFSTNMPDFLNMEPFIQSLVIEESNNGIKIEKEIIEKIIDLKNLKYITLKVNLNDEQILTIQKTNLSVIYVAFQNVNSIFNNFLEKFPNLNEFSFYSQNIIDEDNIFEIKESNNSKINKINLDGVPNGILYCQSFESLKALNFIFREKVKNIEKIIPLFNNNCNIIFKSLTDFYLSYDDIDDEFLNRLKNNFNFIPYLYTFSLTTKSKDISENCYYDFVKMILSKKIDSIKIRLNDPLFQIMMTKQEIKEISPGFNFIYHGTFEISKYKK